MTSAFSWSACLRDMSRRHVLLSIVDCLGKVSQLYRSCEAPLRSDLKYARPQDTCHVFYGQRLQEGDAHRCTRRDSSAAMSQTDVMQLEVTKPTWAGTVKKIGKRKKSANISIRTKAFPIRAFLLHGVRRVRSRRTSVGTLGRTETVALGSARDRGIEPRDFIFFFF